MEAAIALERVTKRYGNGAGAIAAVRDVTLAVAAGEFVSLVGPSGSGKSTLLNLAAALDVPSAGRVLIGGRDVATLSTDARSALRLRHIGFVFQSFHLLPTFTVLENVAWPLEFLGVRRRAAADRAAATLEHVGVAAAAWPRRPAELSGGEQQRAAIARALVTEPGLLVADEPTGNLDSRTGGLVLELLRAVNVNAGTTVLLVTHSAAAAAWARRTIELSDGRIVADVRTDTNSRAAARAPASR